MNGRLKAAGYAVAAAVFYGLNVPCSKQLLKDTEPTFTAAFLYLGAGLGVGIMYLFFHRQEAASDRLEKKDMPYTVGMVLLDIIAPILLMWGVKLGTSANASLLGNFEIAATALIALLLFREKVSRKLWAAIGFVTLSSMILSFGGEGSFSFSAGSLLVLGAAACWGLENNCTRSISEKSTYQIVTIKGFGSGTGSLIIGFIIGEKLPDVRHIITAMVLGFVAYGLSIFTYIRAQKTLGAAKTSAYYALAPFIGAFLSFVILHEALSLTFAAALAVMIVGTAFVVSDTIARSDT
ncbi:DMT family transporter [Ruminococcus sp.]|uniref:DMT family transporter n=1 Tax=Ruminococcus sp. TaxID=41978 RepID=UPI0025CE1953|nr:DMT family transporter [Ruminococcus sp.]MBQ8967092.1 DMT family transporter [Ruminococcus sp.]